jgi:hypothetical protein
LRDVDEFVASFAKRDVKAALPLALAFEEKLEAEGRLSSARLTFDEVDPVRRESAAKDVIKSGEARRNGPALLEELLSTRFGHYLSLERDRQLKMLRMRAPS